MRTRRTAILTIVALLAAMTAGGGSAAAAATGVTTRTTPERIARALAGDFHIRSADDVVQVFIQLDESSVAEFASTHRSATPAAQRSQGHAVQAEQARVESALASKIVEVRSRLVVGANGLRALVRAGDIPAIRATPGVKSVSGVTRYNLDLASSVPSIGGDTVAGAGYTGDGVTVAIIDTGIDYTHEAFGGPGTTAAYDTNDPGVIEAGTFPTPKVIGGFDFAGPVYDASSDDPIINTPHPDADPLDGEGHGTHVAATVAGEEPPNLGMAYHAGLLALKVFGDKAGSTDLVSDAIEMALDPNNDLSIEDHVDVINMSLGSDFGYPDDPSSIASQNAVDNGVVVVAASGNAGDLPYVTSTPALADGVISVAASIDEGVEVLGLTVNSPVGIADDYEATTGDFGSLSTPTTGDLGIAAPLDACTALTNDLSGVVALIQRGTCSFSTKIRNAQVAGAIGAVIYNNQPGAPIGMAQDGTPDQPDIPAMMVGQADGELILTTAQTDTVNVTMDESTRVAKPGMGDEMTDFTSRGPGYGSVFKPDVSAPGYSIEAAAAGTGDGTVLLSGTSMATPHVAGAAAQLLDEYPDLTPAAIKAMLMNSARPAQPDGSVPIARQGTGVVQVDRAALDVGGYASPAGLSFGRVNPTEAGSDTRTITVTRLPSHGDATYDVELIPNQDQPGVTWSLSSDTVGTTSGSGSVDVTLAVDPAAMTADDGFFSQGETDGWVKFTNQSDSNDTMAVGLLAVTDPASQVTAVGGEDMVSVSNTGPSDGFADGFTLAAQGTPAAGLPPPSAIEPMQRMGRWSSEWH